MTRGETGEASSPPSSRSRSPSSPLRTQPHHHSQNFHRNHNLFPGESSSSSRKFCLQSPSDFSLPSCFSNGLCSSEDGSPQFASPPSGGMMTKHNKNVVLHEYNPSNNGLGLCESFHLFNIGEEEEEEEKTRYVRPETHHQNQRSNSGNYEANGVGAFKHRVSSVFGVDQKDQPLLFPTQKGQILNSRNLGMQSYRETLDPYMNFYSSVPSMVYPKSGVGTLFDHQGSSSNMHLQGYVYLMAKDHHGCRYLQRIFEDGTDLDAMIVFNELVPHAAELMMDPIGNNLMQKLIYVCSEEQRTQIILKVTSEPGQLIRISLNAYGTRVVQKLVESIKTRKQYSLVRSALRPGFLTLITNPNGNHVIQRCLQCFSPEDNEFIYDDATKFCIDIATHRHGCCVLQKIITFSIGQQRERLVTELSRHCLFLAQDPYGNYVVQFILQQLRDVSAIYTMLAQLKGHYVELSTHKFSSHMVQRCLTHCPVSRPQIVLELISVSHFDCLLQHPYANFVIYDALVVTKGPLHVALVEVIRPHSYLRRNPYCKRIFSSNDLLKY